MLTAVIITDGITRVGIEILNEVVPFNGLYDLIAALVSDVERHTMGE